MSSRNAKPPVSAEASLIISCCRDFLRTRSLHNLPDAASGINWDTAIHLADIHSVTPILFSSLKQRAEKEKIPDPLHACFQANARKNLTLASELLKILALLQAEGVTAIPLKGPMLAVQVYGNLCLRAFSDLDLLIRPVDVPRARDVLLSNGYSTNWALPSSADSAWLKIKEQQLSFVQANESVLVDLHWGLLPDYCGGALDLESVWSRKQAIPFGGQVVPTLSPEDLLVYLCAHGGKHLWARLGWICDIAALIEARRDMNWTVALATAKRHEARRVVRVGLQLVSQMFGTQLPDEVVRWMRGDAGTASLARDIENRLFPDPRPHQSSWEACRLNLRMMQGLANKIRYFAGIVITPGEAEWRILRLPSWLYPLYYPFRMARMVARFAWFGRR